jgi:hypothetical protein
LRRRKRNGKTNGRKGERLEINILHEKEKGALEQEK